MKTARVLVGAWWLFAVAASLLAQTAQRRTTTGDGPQASVLSPQARKLLGEMEITRPVTIEAFVSPIVPPSLAPMRRDLLNTLKEIEGLLGRKVEVRIHNTEPFSDAAVRAELRFGIRPRTVTSPTRTGSRVDNVFLAVAVTCGYERIVLPFVDSGRSAGYELIRPLDAVCRRQRKKVGILSTDANLCGGSNGPATPQTGKGAIIDELERQYEVVEVDPKHPLAEKYDVLLAVQPSSLGPAEMDNFVAAVRKGQPTVVFEYPFPMLFGVAGTSAPRRPASPFLMAPPSLPKGDIGALWNLLGIDFSADQVVWQDYNPIPKLSSLPKEFVFVDAGCGAKEPFHLGSPMTAKLTSLLFPFPGSLARLNASSLEFTPLVRTGEKTGTVRADDIRKTAFGLGGQLNPDRRQVPQNVAYVLAAHVRGSTPSGGINVAVVADIDVLHEMFFRLPSGAASDTDIGLAFDNAAFALNVIDVLAGDDRFLDLRSRRPGPPALSEAGERAETPTAETEPKADEPAPLKPEQVKARDRILRDYEEARAREEQLLAEKIEAQKKRMQQEKLDPSEVSTRAALLQKAGQLRLEVRLEELKRQRDREIYKLGRRPTPEAPSRAPKPAHVRGQPLFADFHDPSAVAGLEIVRYDEDKAQLRPLVIAQVGGKWSITSHEHYPADAGAQVAALAGRLRDLTVCDVAGDSADDCQRCGVVEPDLGMRAAGAFGAGTRVTLKDARARVLLSLVIGKSVPDRPELRYVRRADQDLIYTATAPPEAFSTGLQHWAERDLLGIAKSGIEGVQVQDYTITVSQQKGQTQALLAQRGRITLAFHQDDPRWTVTKNEVFNAKKGDWEAVEMAADQELDTARLDAMKQALEALKIVDVERKPAELSRRLRASETAFAHLESVVSLVAHGFYLIDYRESPRLLSEKGEVRVLLGDGVECVLRFGVIGSAEAGAAGSDQAPGSTAPGLSRYLLVTAEFNPDAVEKPKLLALPSAATAERQRIGSENNRRQQEHLDKIEKSQDRVKRLNERFADWFYLISDEACRKIRPGYGQIVQKKPRE